MTDKMSDAADISYEKFKLEHHADGHEIRDRHRFLCGFAAGYQAATERAAAKIELYRQKYTVPNESFRSLLAILAEEIRQQESTEVWTQEEIDKAKAEADKAMKWWGIDEQESAGD